MNYKLMKLMNHSKPLYQIHNLKKYYVKGNYTLKALDGLTFSIYPGETLGIVGESGCGKSTLGKLLLKLLEPSSGEIFFQNQDLTSLKKPQLMAFRKKAAMVFQDPYTSLNPRFTASDIVGEPLEIHFPLSKQERKEKIIQLLEQVGLGPQFALRYSHELSGGQRQRLGIARALALNPEFIVCDEPVSALDVSIQAQIINLLRSIQVQKNLSYLFIAHDLRVVKYISDRVGVMYLGHLVELTSSEELYRNPLHPYTQALLSAIPIADPRIERSRHRIVLTGDIPSADNPPKGCVFSTRCPFAKPICHEVRPEWKEVSKGHFAACHLLKS